MPDYQVTLLGIPGVFKNGEPIRFPYQKVEGIFYYLCVETHTNRDELISLFWGSLSEDTGRKNLRQALFQLRRCLGDDIIILQGRNDLKLNRRYELENDWTLPEAEFSLRRDKFLEFFYLTDCPEFETWVDKKRAQQIARNLAYIERQLADPALCRDVSRLQCLMDTWQYWKPWDEEMVLTGLRCYMQAGQYDPAISLYRSYVTGLRRDLDEEPSHAVELLYRTALHRKEAALRQRPDGRHTFFGRMTELSYLDEQVFLFLNDETSISVLIEGEVGIGKTELMQQILDMNRDSDALQLVSHCYSVEAEFPLKSWRDLFVQLKNLHSAGQIRLSDDSARLIPLMLSGMVPEDSGLFCDEEGGSWNYTALENRILGLFKELVEHKKLILYFDSLHWMDPVSQRLLQRIMIEFGNEQIFLIATSRIYEERMIRGLLLALRERAILTVLPLSGFTEEETKTVAEAALKDCKNVGIDAHELFLRTEGNPLVLMETLDMIRQTGWNGKHPLPRISMLIQIKLERLTAPQRKVLEALSVHFEHADLEDLRILVQMETLELIDTLEQLLAAGFITEETWGSNIIYKFKHQFYKNYIYQKLSLGKRRFWHCAVAEFYDSQKDEERRQVLLPYTIRHYECGGNSDRADALRNVLTPSAT